MAVRPVRLYGDPVLRQKALPVATVDDTVRELVRDLRDTMRAYNGVGLAANQVGVKQRVLVVDVPLDDEQRARFALVNPVVTRRFGSETAEEGCLSMPGIYEDVVRAERVQVEALDENGKPIRIEADGYLARALQHEVDHLDGVLFTDRLSPLRRQFLRRSLDALARGEMPDGYRSPMESGGER
ncbi:MAG TPA: peptide deformylase [Candidatus Saccharimonadaceae bacterium]|jgi:peptide deformylase|nr:peptide deformylase [Candidatus Saccharimonadaceae bacterium]